MPPEPLTEWIEDGVAWLAEHAGESVGFEQALRSGRWRGARHLAAFQTAAGIEALSLITAEGHWFLEGTQEVGVLHLCGLARAAAAVRLDTSERVAAWVRPLLVQSGQLTRDVELLALVCRRHPAEAAGRWAESGDLPILAALGNAAWPAGGGPDRQDWEDLAAARKVALIERGGNAAAVVLETATSDYAVIGPLLVAAPDSDTTAGEAALSALLIGFVTRELLASKSAVLHRIETAAAESRDLFAAAGFVRSGHSYRAWLKGKT